MVKKILLLGLSLAQLGVADTVAIIPTVSVAHDAVDSSVADVYSDETTTISHKALQKNPNTTLTDVLKSQSAVRVANNSGNSYQSILSIRGFGDNAQANSLILVDGFPLINASLLAPNFNAILLSDIQKIDLFQGSQGSLWGNQAVGGVVAIETLHPQKPVGNLSVSYGSYNNPFVSGLYGDKLANGFFYKVSGFDTTTTNAREHDRQTNGGLALQEGFDYATGSLTLNQKIYDDTTHFPGGLTKEQMESDPSQATDTSDYTHYRTQIYQLLNQQMIDNHWRLETRVSTTHIASDGWFHSPTSSTESLNWFNPQLIGNKDGRKLTLGYVGQTSDYQQTLTPSTNSTAARAYQNDLYAQTVIPVAKKWALTLGARGAWQNNSPQLVLGQTTHYQNSAFVTEQGVNYHWRPEWSWFIRRDGNFRFPKTNEDVWLASDQTELKPQTGVSYETGVAWKTPKQRYQFSVYELWLHNEIAYDPTQTATQPFGATSNFDETLRKGLSFGAETPLSEKILLTTQLNYVDARFVAGPDSGNTVPAVPAYNGSAGLDYQWNPHWRTSYTESYNGNAYASNDTGNTGAKAASYWLGQWALQYGLKNIMVSFQINNLFDQTYAVYTTYSQSTQTDSYYPGAGRNYLLSIKATLA